MKALFDKYGVKLPANAGPGNYGFGMMGAAAAAAVAAAAVPPERVVVASARAPLRAPGTAA